MNYKSTILTSSSEKRLIELIEKRIQLPQSQEKMESYRRRLIHSKLNFFRF